MRKALLAVGLLALLSGSGLANLIVNGGFEEPFETGWKDTVFSMAGDFRYERGDTFGNGTGYAAKVYKYLASFASLYQAVPVTGLDLTLSFDARLLQGSGSSTCWPVAAFFARYLNAGGNEIGATCWYNHSVYADWRDNDTMNLIEITSADWNHYEINLADEIATNLPGVNAADVAMVCVDLFAYDNGT
jgi:hypothetical protein